ncbi:MlaA family lipoprotein [Arenibacterium sp. CAU 1754]
MRARLQHTRIVGVLLIVGLLGACATGKSDHQSTGDVFDPYEKTNRGIHEFNRGVDKLFFRPASKGYVSVVPEPIVESMSYFADNLSMPRNIVNSLLQGNLKAAGAATARFLMNTTIGFAGLADPATEFGIPEADTDFGETLHVWGVREGAYIELPFIGPSNQRDAVGTVVDFFTNPLSYATNNPMENASIYAEVFQRMGERGRFADTYDSILYESADSYAQARVIYLQNRRFELAGEGGEVYDDPYADDYADPYENPYDE